jgi:hypothetical protein
MSVADIEIDITNYSGRKDFHVSAEFIDANNYNVVVKRLDSTDGWTENLKVFVVYANETTEVVPVGSSSESVKRVQVTTSCTLCKQEQEQEQPKPYNLHPYPEPQYISRTLFNKIFNTDIVVLPRNMFAVGVRKGCVYIYNDTNEYLYMIELTIKHVVSVALTKDLFTEFHFVICAYDGYMEHHYYSERTEAKQIGETEQQGKNTIIMESPTSYPKFHKDSYILTQNALKGIPNVINVPDRYYFYLNRYNEYRSIHQGQSFASKKNQIVFGSQPRGTKYNFIKRQDINMSPREYFNSDAVPKINIVSPDWIPRKDMIGYKYILDIDGNSSTWDATAWKLNSGSVILKSESMWSQWFYEDYKPWVHYVPVAEDFSDIQEKYAWCESHQDECVAMIKECKQLFQNVYRLNNVIKMTENSIYKLNRLEPYFVDERRVFFITTENASMPNLNVNIQSVAKSSNSNNINKYLEVLHNIVRKLKPSDIIVHVNPKLMDMNMPTFDIKQFMAIYDSLNAKIVFGAEKNLWPGELESVRYKIESVANSTTDFKYLNAGFYVAEVAEMTRLLDERVHELNQNEQDYFSRAYITKRYSFILDNQQKLVLNTYKCSAEEINAKKQAGVPFINYNAGR